MTTAYERLASQPGAQVIGPYVSLPCACGGRLMAKPESTMAAVQAHQAAEPHASWADREYPSLDPTAPRVSRDVSARQRARPARREVLVGLGYEL